jgi:Tat protein translocase TatB subunit
MFGIGMPELMLIFVLGLLIFGPKELPRIARTLGKAMAELRRTSDELRDGIQREIDFATREEGTPAPPAESVPTTTLADGAAPSSSEQPGDVTAGDSAEASVTSSEAIPQVSTAETAASAPEGEARPTGTEKPATTSVAPALPETGEPKGSPEGPKESPPQAETASHAPAHAAEIRNA